MLTLFQLGFVRTLSGGVGGDKKYAQQILHFEQALEKIPGRYYELTHMIKIGPNIFRITSLFCLSQHFFVMTLIFTQNFGNYSFVSIY